MILICLAIVPVRPVSIFLQINPPLRNSIDEYDFSAYPTAGLFVSSNRIYSTDFTTFSIQGSEANPPKIFLCKTGEMFAILSNNNFLLFYNFQTSAFVNTYNLSNANHIYLIKFNHDCSKFAVSDSALVRIFRRSANTYVLHDSISICAPIDYLDFTSDMQIFTVNCLFTSRLQVYFKSTVWSLTDSVIQVTQGIRIHPSNMKMATCDNTVLKLYQLSGTGVLSGVVTAPITSPDSLSISQNYIAVCQSTKVKIYNLFLVHLQDIVAPCSNVNLVSNKLLFLRSSLVQFYATCNTNQYRYIQLCLTQCPKGFHPDSSMKICQRCLWHQIQNSCVTICPDGYFADADLLCNPCKPECLTCVDGSSCNSCKGHYLQNNQCVSVCQPLKFINLQNMRCQYCLDFIYHKDRVCYKNCPSGTYHQVIVIIITFKSCKNCNEPCLTCSSHSSCIKCVSGFFFFENSCVSECPALYYKGEIECQRCQTNCRKCLNKQICQECMPGYLLQQTGKCKVICSSDEFQLNGLCLNYQKWAVRIQIKVEGIPSPYTNKLVQLIASNNLTIADSKFFTVSSQQPYEVVQVADNQIQFQWRCDKVFESSQVRVKVNLKTGDRTARGYPFHRSVQFLQEKISFSCLQESFILQSIFDSVAKLNDRIYQTNYEVRFAALYFMPSAPLFFNFLKGSSQKTPNQFLQILNFLALGNFENPKCWDNSCEWKSNSAIDLERKLLQIQGSSIFIRLINFLVILVVQLVLLGLCYLNYKKKVDHRLVTISWIVSERIHRLSFLLILSDTLLFVRERVRLQQLAGVGLSCYLLCYYLIVYFRKQRLLNFSFLSKQYWQLIPQFSIIIQKYRYSPPEACSLFNNFFRPQNFDLLALLSNIFLVFGSACLCEEPLGLLSIAILFMLLSHLAVYLIEPFRSKRIRLIFLLQQYGTGVCVGTIGLAPLVFNRANLTMFSIAGWVCLGVFLFILIISLISTCLDIYQIFFNQKTKNQILLTIKLWYIEQIVLNPGIQKDQLQRMIEEADLNEADITKLPQTWVTTARVWREGEEVWLSRVKEIRFFQKSKFFENRNNFQIKYFQKYRLSCQAFTRIANEYLQQAFSIELLWPLQQSQLQFGQVVTCGEPRACVFRRRGGSRRLDFVPSKILYFLEERCKQ